MGCYEFGAEPYLPITQHLIPNTMNQMTNFPNPFNPETTISFSVTETSSFVTVEIFNIKGQKVKTLMDCKTAPGNYKCVWNGRNDSEKRVASGEYLATLKVNEQIVAERKMLLLK
jgi:flagellar hook assembly protein FlgD